MDFVIDWLLKNWIETIAAVLGLIGIFLQIKQNHWYWLSAIIMVLMYIFVFYKAKFYADMSFQFYYLVISCYGWFLWLTKKSGKAEKKIHTSKLSLNQWLYSLLASGVFFVVIYLILKRFTDSDVALGDAFTTSLSFVATLLLARKILENWLFWIVVDVVSTGLYLYKGLYPTAILFTVLSGLAVYGYLNWKKSLINE